MPHIVELKEEEISDALAAAIAATTLIQGAQPSQWWNREARRVLDSFMDQMRESVANEETLAQAVTRIKGGTVNGVTMTGLIQRAQRQSDLVTSTVLQAIVNMSRLQTFQANSDVVKAIQQISTLDNRTSDICIAYSDQTWDIETLMPLPPSTLPFNGGPPRHFNCRSTLVPVLRSWEELGMDLAEVPEGTRASMDGQVPGSTTFASWLSGKSQSFQDQVLGPARARLWREGKITLTQLVDMRGNPLTLEQLEERIKRNKPPRG